METKDDEMDRIVTREQHTKTESIPDKANKELSRQDVGTIEATKPSDMDSKIDMGQPREEGEEREGVGKRAYELFMSGHLCSEAISAAVLDVFTHVSYEGVIRCASAFGGGVGGTLEDLCGAYTGGVLTLGYLLGREEPDDSLKECGVLIKEFRKQFMAEFGSLNCPTILKRFASQDNPQMGCAQLTALSAQILADLLAEAEVKKGIVLGVFLSQPRAKAGVGRCPFSACK